MKLGLISSCAVGLTVALTLGSAPANAQATGRDTTTRGDTSGVAGATSGSSTARTGRRARRSSMGNKSSMNMAAGDSMNMNASDTTHVRHHRRSTHRRRSASNATSSTRIPLSKESKGEVIDTTTKAAPTPAPVDTATPAPPPPPPAPVDTTTPVDTTRRDTTTTTATVIPPLSMRRIGSFYWGIGAGATLPQQNMTNGYHPGFNVTVPFGWDSQSIPLGLRFDAGYDRMYGRNDVGVNGDLAVWSGNADAKLRLGSILHHFYVLGGVGASRIVGYGSNNYTPGTTTGVTATTSTAYPYTTAPASSFSNASTVMNWNAGAGVNFGWGVSSLFLESRYFHVNSNNTLGANTRFVPVIIGLQFR